MKKTKMLKKNYEFKKVLENGKFFSGKKIIVFIKKNNAKKEINYNFLGLAISSKTCKAVRRNRIKRIIRESYYFYEKDILTGNSIVILWNKKADPINVSFFDIKNDMKYILEKANLLKNDK